MNPDSNQKPKSDKSDYSTLWNLGEAKTRNQFQMFCFKGYAKKKREIISSSEESADSDSDNDLKMQLRKLAKEKKKKKRVERPKSYMPMHAQQYGVIGPGVHQRLREQNENDKNHSSSAFGNGNNLQQNNHFWASASVNFSVNLNQMAKREAAAEAEFNKNSGVSSAKRRKIDTSVSSNDGGIKVERNMEGSHNSADESDEGSRSKGPTKKSPKGTTSTN